MPVSGITNSAQPIIGYNYGAHKYSRVKTAIGFMSIVSILYTVAIWGVLYFFPTFFIQIFNKDVLLLHATIEPLRIYYFGFFMMSLQFAGQATFVALGKSKHAIFFSLLRKVIIVIPLTIFLPTLGELGTTGVFLAEPISNFIGGILCFLTMLFTVLPTLKEKKTTS